MKVEKIFGVLGMVVIVCLAGAIIWKANIIGVAQERLEADARENQEIAEDWAVARAVNEEMCAMLFYDEETAECSYSVYLTHEDEMSTGYFYSQGGRDAYMAESAKALIFEDRGVVILSMNAEGISEIVTAAGSIQVDPAKPFVVLLPLESGEITLYDAQKNVVTLYDTYTG